jgi:predicted transcriptional regulator
MAWAESKFGTKAELNAKADKIDLETKVDKKTDEETIEMLIEADLLPAVSTPSEAVLTDQNGNIVLRY